MQARRLFVCRVFKGGGREGGAGEHLHLLRFEFFSGRQADTPAEELADGG